MRTIEVSFVRYCTEVPVTDEVYVAIYNKGYADGTLAIREEMIKHNEAYAQGRADAIDKYEKALKNNFMRMIGEHTIGEILDKTYKQLKEQNR